MLRKGIAILAAAGCSVGCAGEDDGSGRLLPAPPPSAPPYELDCEQTAGEPRNYFDLEFSGGSNSAHPGFDGEASAAGASVIEEQLIVSGSALNDDGTMQSLTLVLAANTSHAHLVGTSSYYMECDAAACMDAGQSRYWRVEQLSGELARDGQVLMGGISLSSSAAGGPASGGLLIRGTFAVCAIESL